MPRYEFRDGKSQKFWEIHRDGDTYTVRYGRLGTDGATSQKVFASEAAAEKAVEKITASKVKKGYVLVDDGETAVEEEVASDRHPDLEAAIVENPDDPEAWAVFGDWLQTIGDARGELVQLGLRESTPEIERRIRELTEAHRSEWMGPALAKLVARGEKEDQEEWSSVCRFGWERGFLVDVRVGTVWDWAGPTPLELLRAILRDPSARFLRRVAVGLLDPEDYEGHLDGALLALSKAGKIPSVRHVHVGDFEYPDQTEISWTDVGDAGRLYPVFPNLESLHLQGGGISLGDLRHARLRRLKLETGGLPPAATRAVGAADLPELEDLEMWLGTPDYGGDTTLADLEPLLSGGVLPKLRRLGLMNSELTDDLVPALAESPLLARVAVLDLSMGTMTDVGARRLLDAADRFRHLESIDLSDNYLSGPVAAELAAAFGGKIDVSSQEAPDEWDGELHTYVSVSE